MVVITSVPYLHQNQIQKNRSNGIMIMKDARPKITSNYIRDNDGIGLFIRDISCGTIKENQLKNNEVELVLDRLHTDLENIATKDNLIVGDIRIPQNLLDCAIF